MMTTPEIETTLPADLEAGVKKLSFDQLSLLITVAQAEQEDRRSAVADQAAAMGLSCSINGTKKRKPRHSTLKE